MQMQGDILSTLLEVADPVSLDTLVFLGFGHKFEFKAIFSSKTSVSRDTRSATSRSVDSISPCI